MTALTQARNTPYRPGRRLHDLIAAGAVIHTGALVCLNATGYLEPGSVSTALRARGVAEVSADNSGGADGDMSVGVTRGVYSFGNAAGDPVVQADVGNDCYILDDQTVARTSGTSTRSVAGKILDLDAGGVWVEIL